VAGLSLTEAWNETAAFVKREGRLLFPVAFLMVALPRAVLGLLAPAALPGRLPEPGAWLLIAPVAIVLGTIANIAISWLALRPGGSVGEALARGARRVLPLLALFLMLGIALGLVFLVLATIALLLFVPGAGTVPPPPGAMRAILIVLVPMVPLLLYLAARLLAATPVAAAEPGGPFAILARSWALSAGRVGTLLGFIVLAALLAIVISLAVQAVAGLGVIAALGPPRPGNLSLLILLLVGAVVETVVTVCLTTMVARIYAQLAGAPTSGT
jgi:hypothetical protein